jgi:transcriptional regulator with XRE-family HTH domain
MFPEADEANMNMNQTISTKAVAGRSGGRHVFKQHRLLDTVMEALSLKSDAGLARRLDVTPPLISLLRSGKRRIGPSMLLRMHEVSDIPISQLRALMSDEAQNREI